MEDNDNPYDILGVSRDATEQQIKTAYRKLALRHHPDKQKTDADREKATIMFAKISNAYETVGDAAQRAKYDRLQQANAPYRKMPRQQSQQDFFHDVHFHDPFSVFERVFGEEFGTRNGSGRHSFPTSAAHRQVFDDPFFRDPFMRRSSPDVFGDFGADPFFGGGLGGSLFGRGFGGGFGEDPFSSMHQQMNSMRDLHQNMMSSGLRGSGSGANPRQSSVVYSSSQFSGFPGSQSVSTSTTTRIVNGKRQVVTEHVVTKPDGSVERKVETSQDEHFPQLYNEKEMPWGYLEDAQHSRPMDHKRKRRSSKQT